MSSSLLVNSSAVKPAPFLSMALLTAWISSRQLAKWTALYAVLSIWLGQLCKYPWEIPGVAVRLTYAATVAVTDYVARGFKPLFDEWTLPFEIARAVGRAMAMHYAYRTRIPRNAKMMRLHTQAVGAILGAFTCWQHGTETESFQYNGLEHIWLRLKNKPPSNPAQPRRRCVVLYYHGGGYAILSPRYYVSSTSELLVRIHALLEKSFASNAVDIDVLLANYRKTPEHPYPTPPNDAHTMYRYLLDVEGIEPQNILIVGDSAGAGLSLATLLRVRDSNPAELPCGAILSSPFVDLETRGDERRAPYCVLADGSVNVTREMYVPWGGCPKTWGDASPLHCHLGGLPEAYIITGEFDYLLAQAHRLMARAKEDGVTNWHMDIHKHMVHVFMHIPPFVLPHASKGLEAMAVFAARKLVEERPSQPACSW